MSVLQHYSQDEQFLRLVRREQDVDLVVAALEIARDDQPDLNFEETLKVLRRSVGQLTRPIAMAGADISELNVLVEYLTGELNLHGDFDCYDHAESSYLNHVIQTGRGLPIALSVVYMAVANELGIPLQGVAAPSHFLTRLQTDDTVVYVDPFRSGHIMEERECLKWLSEITEITVDELRPTLKPVSGRAIVVRMLNNLKTLFGNRNQWYSAWRVQNRLTLLSPGSYRERRDLAILTLRAGRYGQAVTQLETCLLSCSPEEKTLLNQCLNDARRQLPQLN